MIVAFGLGRNIVADSPIMIVAELQIGDTVIPVLALQTAEIGARNETVFGCNLKLGLEGKCLVPALIR